MVDPLPAFLTSLTPPDFSSWIVVLFCLITIGFFSGMEIAFISANKLRIELKSKHGSFGGKWLTRYIKKPNEFISTVLVATNLALVIYGIAIGDILSFYLTKFVSNTFLVFLLTTVISTLLVLVTAEFIPKTIFKLQADSLIFLFAFPFRIAHVVLWPIITFTKSASAMVLKLFANTKLTEETTVFSKVDLDNYISSIENSSNFDSQEIDTEAFRNALDFSDVIVRDLMIPRTELVAVDIITDVKTISELFISTSLSRILIFKDNIDNIIGFVHHSDLFHTPEKITDILHPVIIVSETLEAHDILRRFLNERKSMAVVVDEFGGTAGIATVEDVVEEIFGEIKDEFDVEDANEIVLNENHFRFSSRLEIDYLNEKYQFNLAKGDYNTLGGYIIYCAERIPTTGDIIRHNQFEFVVKKMTGARIDEVELRIFKI